MLTSKSACRSPGTEQALPDTRQAPGAAGSFPSLPLLLWEPCFFSHLPPLEVDTASWWSAPGALWVGWDRVGPRCKADT